ncbi:MAG: glycosyltransferase [Gammaproteobacteria bacterium]|nr:glycosyltransferase [Gammaproteobacteria bacterium]
MTDSIPPIAHFVWFGRSFPWLNWLAVRSAADRGGYEQVILHHADDLSGAQYFVDLLRTPRVKCVHLDYLELVDRVIGVAPRIVEVAKWAADRPAMQSDLARMALLWIYGGVYLDVDTVTVAPLDALRAAGGVFCGRERLVWPGVVRASRNPLVFGAAVLRSVTRDLLRRHPRGWRHFRRIEHWFPTAANGAVLGAAPGHPFLAELLGRAGALRPEDLVRSRNALGPELLQDALRGAGAAAATDIRVLPPEVFFPLGPEISEHWFRVHPPGKRPRLEEVLYPDTRVVHWYGSVRAREIMRVFDARYVRAHRDRQLLAELAAPWANPGGEDSAPA